MEGVTLPSSGQTGLLRFSFWIIVCLFMYFFNLLADRLYYWKTTSRGST